MKLKKGSPQLQTSFIILLKYLYLILRIVQFACACCDLLLLNI